MKTTPFLLFLLLIFGCKAPEEQKAPKIEAPFMFVEFLKIEALKLLIIIGFGNY